MWTAVVVTCPFKSWCDPLEREVHKILKLGGHRAENVVVVPDPGEDDDVGVGSGGATLNALLVVTEYLSARQGHTTVVADLLHSSKVLIVHLGPSLLPLPTGLQYISDHHDNIVPSTNLERTISMASLLSAHNTAGVMVASADILLSGDLRILDTVQGMTGDIVLPTVRAETEYAVKHGVVVTSSDASVRNILYQPQLQELHDSSHVDIISGLVWFSPAVSESLLKLYSLSPIDGCTYMGADSGETSLQMSLYYDLLPAACSAVSRSEFETGKCGKTLKRGRSSSSLMVTARKEVWSELRRYRIWSKPLQNVTHKYLNICNSVCDSELLDQWRMLKPLHLNDSVVARNSVNNIMIDCQTRDDMNNCSLQINQGLSARSDDVVNKIVTAGVEDLVVINYPTLHHGVIQVVFSAGDDLNKVVDMYKGTFLGLTWSDALKLINKSEDEVWPWMNIDQRTLNNAKLFQGLSLMEIRRDVDIDQSLQWRTMLHQQIFCAGVESGQLLPVSRYQSLFQLSVAESWSPHLLSSLDQCSLQCARSTSDQHMRTSSLASLLAKTADLLGCMAGN